MPRITYDTEYSRYFPSDEYLKNLRWARQWHASHKTFHGKRSFAALPSLVFLCQQYGAKSLLDYGCGKGAQYSEQNFTIKRMGIVPNLLQATKLEEIYPYDPAWPEYAKPPQESDSFDGSLTVDVLEYIPSDDLRWVLTELAGWARKFVLINYSCAGTTKPDGDDAPQSHYWHPEGFTQLLTECAASQPQLDLVCRLQSQKKEHWRIWRRLPHQTDWLLIEDSQLWPEGAAKE